MKNLLFFAVIGFIFLFEFSQLKAQCPNNTLPGNGSVGIQNTSPNKLLEISGDNTCDDPTIRISYGTTTPTIWGHISFMTPGNYNFYSTLTTEGDLLIQNADGSEDIVITTRDNTGYLRFGTTPSASGDDFERMTITPDGFVGINQPTPDALFQVYQGNVFFNGTSSTSLPSIADEPICYWYPNKSAFRAGIAVDDYWDDNNVGILSVAFGQSTKASGMHSFAQGFFSEASASFSIAMGSESKSSGFASVSMGNSNTATALSSVAMGTNSIASGNYAVALGFSSTASGLSAFAMGGSSKASGDHSLAVGGNSTASGNESVALGYQSNATGIRSVALSNGTASGFSSFAFGPATIASGSFTVGFGSSTSSGTYSFAAGESAIASGRSSGAFGNGHALADFSFATGLGIANKPNAFAAGGSTASGTFSTGLGASVASGDYSVAGGGATIASGDNAVVFGDNSTASGNVSFSEGYETLAEGAGSIAMGISCTATDLSSIAMGYNTYSSGWGAVAVGSSTTATNQGDFAGGDNTLASGSDAFAYGLNSVASGAASTALCSSTASAIGTFAAGYDGTTASGQYSYALGNYISTNSKNGSMILGDRSTTTVTNNTYNNQLVARFEGNSPRPPFPTLNDAAYIFYTSSNLSNGMYMLAADNSWRPISCSRYTKENFKPVNHDYILNSIREMPITEWNYIKDQNKSKYIGPVSQDFYKYFKYGAADTTSYNMYVFSSIALTGVQGLILKSDKTNAKIDTLENHLKLISDNNESVYKLKKENEELKLRLQILEDKLNSLSLNTSTDCYKDVYLEQNSPNPFNTISTINYFIPERYSGTIELVISGSAGDMPIKRIPLQLNVFGNVMINAQDFMSGVYTYGIEYNGTLIKSNKFIVMK